MGESFKEVIERYLAAKDERRRTAAIERHASALEKYTKALEESNMTAKKTVERSPTPAASSSQSSGNVFKLNKVFSHESMKPYLDVGVRCGYLLGDYSRNVKSTKAEFFVYAKFIGNHACITRYRKECGLQWYGDEDALKWQREQQVPEYDSLMTQLKKALNSK